MAKTYNPYSIRRDYANLTRLLIEKNLTVTTMESATAGQIASLITDTQGASGILKGAFITYSNEAKIMYGVSSETIEKYSVYSMEVAQEMALACARIYKADIGIGVTGTFGNIDPKNQDSSMRGHIYFAICFQGTTQGYELILDPQPSRLMYKLAVAKEIYEHLITRECFH